MDMHCDGCDSDDAWGIVTVGVPCRIDRQRLNSFVKNSRESRRLPSAAEAVIENKAFIAALKRCATQKQEQGCVFQQTVKPSLKTKLLSQR